MTHDDLPALVKQLKSEGINAERSMVGEMNRNGITVRDKSGGGEFFSLAELNNNADLLASRDFDGIKAGRSGT